MTETTAIIPTETTLSVFSGENNFKNAMKMAQELSKSDIIPTTYKGKPENCLIAIELSNRLKLSPFLVMQNMHVIQGRPSWSSTFIISCINASGRFQGGLKFEMDANRTKCRAYATEKSGEKLTGPLITMDMAQSEGWLSKNGSKWKTMPELMLRYRAAAFFGRLYCPEIINGMLTDDEVTDIRPIDESDVTDVFAEETPAQPDVQKTQVSPNVDEKLQELADQFYEENKDKLND